MDNLDKMFPPKFFNQNPIEEILRKSELNVLTMLKTENNRYFYQVFNEQFELYLYKLPTSPVKKYVKILFDKDLIYIGYPINKNDTTTYSRILLTRVNELVGIILNATILDINAKTGETTSIDDCIYAAYYSFIRTAALAFPSEIKRDKELLKILANYVFLLYLKLLGKSTIISGKQKQFLEIICTYMFYKHFMDMKHEPIVDLIEKDLIGKNVPKEIYDEIKPKMNILKSYVSMKDVPRALTEFKIITVNPSQVFMDMIKYFRQQGFYSIFGSLDYLLASCVLSIYPSSIIPKFMLTNEDTHKYVERKVNMIMDKIKYNPDVLPRYSKTNTTNNSKPTMDEQDEDISDTNMSKKETE